MSTTTVSTAAALVSALKTAHSGDTILLSAGSYGAISISSVNIAGNVTASTSGGREQSRRPDQHDGLGQQQSDVLRV